MVWADSVKFGCGKARSRTGKIIVVANYEPKVSKKHVSLKHISYIDTYESYVGNALILKIFTNYLF